jgi:hypothetical protein
MKLTMIFPNIKIKKEIYHDFMIYNQKKKKVFKKIMNVTLIIYTRL